MSMVELKVVKKRFVDLDLTMAMHPISKDVSRKVNESAIIASVKNLVLTKMYGRPFHPELSSQVHSLLFEPLTPATSAVLERTIRYVIENFEPRVEVVLIQVSQEAEDAIRATIVFNIVGLVGTIKTSFVLQRTL